MQCSYNMREAGESAAKATGAIQQLAGDLEALNARLRELSDKDQSDEEASECEDVLREFNAVAGYLDHIQEELDQAKKCLTV